MTSEQAPLRIGVRLRLAGTPGELLADARAVEAASVDSIWVAATDADPYVLLAALAAVTWRVRLVAVGAPASPARATCAALAMGRLAVAEELTGERWVHHDFPASRAVWREWRDAAAAEGAMGVVIPADPRLIDLLRNPDSEDDRSDLNIAVG